MIASIFEKKIPTLLALVVIAVAIFGTSFLVQNLRPFGSFATTTGEPHDVKITNVDSTTFTVSWITEESITGSLRFWRDKNNELTTLDVRDKPGGINPYKTHYVTLNNLAINTKYLFVINSGKDTFDNNGTPYEVTTLAEKLEKKIKIKGSIIREDGTNANGVFVYLIDNLNPFSSITTKGTWEISAPDISSFNLFATDGESSSNVKSNTANVTTITLGQDYDFTTQEQKELEGTTSAKKSFPLNGTKKTVTSPQIISPKEGDSFVDTKPRLLGTAPSGATITITIESTDPITATVKADSNGNWTYRPSIPLAPGVHKITITAPDSSGILRSITKNFTVFAQGSQVATPSATPSPTAKITPTLTPTPTVLTPTPLPTSLPTTIPTKAPAPVPVTGSTLPLIILGAIGTATFLLGLALLF